MKTLIESLFDNDIKKSEVLLGELYNLSQKSHLNSVTNNIDHVLGMFDLKKLNKTNFKIKTDPNNEFIKYWKKYDRDIEGFVNMILNMPAQLFFEIEKDKIGRMVEVAKEKYFSKYFTNNRLILNLERAYISIISYGSGNNKSYKFIIYDNINYPKASSIKLTFEPK